MWRSAVRRSAVQRSTGYGEQLRYCHNFQKEEYAGKTYIAINLLFVFDSSSSATTIVNFLPLHQRTPPHPPSLKSSPRYLPPPTQSATISSAIPSANISARDLFMISTPLHLPHLHHDLWLDLLHNCLLSQDLFHFHHHFCHQLSYLFQSLHKLHHDNHSI